MADTMRQKTRKRHPQSAGLQEFAQALNEANTPQEYLQNPDVIKAMQKPGKISAPKPFESSHVAIFHSPQNHEVSRCLTGFGTRLQSS